MKKLPEQMEPAKTKRSYRFWLLGGVTVLLILLLTFFFFAGRIISSPKVKQKIQQAISEQSGVEVAWGTIGLSNFPYPAIILQKVKMKLPDRLHGDVEELRITPEIMPLLTGDLRLTRIVLEKPVIDLYLAESDTVKASEDAKSKVQPEENLNKSIMQLGQVVPELDLFIRDGRLSVTSGRQNLVIIEKMELQLGLKIDDSSSFRGDVQGKVSKIIVFPDDQEEIIRNAEIKGSASINGSKISVVLKKLALTQPGVALNGNLTMDSHTPGITLNLTGKDIDVDATRRVALALAGDISPVKLIFDYLRGGTIPHITFQSEGETIAELGDSKNYHIEGELLQGNVIVPAANIDLTNLSTEILVADGITARVDKTDLSWKGFTWTPVKGTIGFKQGKTIIEVIEAKLCSTNSVGELTFEDTILSLDFSVDEKGLDVTDSYICLTKGNGMMTGTLDIVSRIRARGKADELMKKLWGPLEINLTNGVIKQDMLLAKILKVLNVTEIVKGKLPELGSAGYAYSSITLQGKFKESKLIIDKFYMDGDTIDLLGEGEVDLEHETLNIKLMAAPLQTVDTVVKNVPGVNYLLAGNLLTIPLSIQGDLADPTVRTISASSVSTRLLKLGERTLKSPSELIKTLTRPEEKKRGQ